MDKDFNDFFLINDLVGTELDKHRVVWGKRSSSIGILKIAHICMIPYIPYFASRAVETGDRSEIDGQIYRSRTNIFVVEEEDCSTLIWERLGPNLPHTR